MTETGFSAGVRTFELTTAARDILALATTAGSPGTSYRFDIDVNALGEDGAGEPVSTAGTVSRRRSVFTATGTPSTASIAANTIFIAADGNAGVNYYFPNTGTLPQFPNNNFTSATNSGGTPGAFDVNNGQLRLNNTSVTTTETGANVINTVVLYYRTRLTSNGGGAYQAITLSPSGNVVNGVRNFIIDPASTNNTNAQPNLIATPDVTAAGNYTVDVYYQANGSNTSTGIPFTIAYPPTAAFSATFTVAGSLIATTIWTGVKNDNWFDDANWSNGKPTPTTNALIRDLGAGNNVPYPNINSDTRVTIAGGDLLYDNTGSGPAKARNLTLGGTSQASRSIARLVTGQLQVFGNFDNSFDSFIQRESTIMEFAGTNQNITGGTFFRVDISGGGTKTLVGAMTIQTSLNFLTGINTGTEPAVVNPYTASNANAGILSTNISNPSVSLVVLTDRTSFNNFNGSQLTGETDFSYLYGFVRTSRSGVVVGEARTYGNMGLAITFGGPNNPGNVDVTRNTVESYTPLNNRFSIRRIFGVRPSDAATNTGGLIATLVFRYRDSETQNLNGPNTIAPGTGSIPESNLLLFVSQNSGNTFGALGRDGAIDQTNNILTKSGVRVFATFTLGDSERPLPVRLTAFDAKRIGSDALVTWQTAQEENSKGYEVQVSTNGTEYRTLAAIPSASPNTTQVTNYSYVDKEANKTGKRYYRLHQIDLDGQNAFFAPMVVSFEGKAPASSFVAYPNPFNAGSELHVVLQSAATGTARLLVTDMTGRTLQEQNVVLTGSLTDTPVASLGDLKAGLYLVKIILPTGEVKNLKVVKQ